MEKETGSLLASPLPLTFSLFTQFFKPLAVLYAIILALIVVTTIQCRSHHPLTCPRLITLVQEYMG